MDVLEVVSLFLSLAFMFYYIWILNSYVVAFQNNEGAAMVGVSGEGMQPAQAADEEGSAALET
jgi:hypothetical protein